jgi:hypothetical protein
LEQNFFGRIGRTAFLKNSRTSSYCAFDVGGKIWKIKRPERERRNRKILSQKQKTNQQLGFGR